MKRMNIWMVMLCFLQYKVMAFKMGSLSYLFALGLSPVTQISNEMTQQIADRGLDILNGLQANQLDCFQKSTLSIRNGCQQLVSDETTQINYALMLTLCELATAQISVPVECQADHPSIHLPDCIKKLAAIPQTWTTYSGYYRDVITICFAIRYPLEKELLLQAQHNMTYYQSKNYDLLQQQQHDLYTWRQQEIQLLDNIRLQQTDIWNQFVNLQKTSTNELSDMVTTIKQVRQMAVDIYATQKITMDSHQQQLEENMRQWGAALSLVDHGIDSINTKMHAISSWQNQTLVMYHQWQELQHQATQQWQQSIDHAHQGLVNLINYTEDRLHLIQEDILDIHTIISTITKPARLVFHSTLVLWNNGAHLFGLAFMLVSCHLLPSSPWYNLGKLLVLGYYVKSSSHWPSIAVCLIWMTALLVAYLRKHYLFLFPYKATTASLLKENDVMREMDEQCSDRLELYYSLLIDE